MSWTSFEMVPYDYCAVVKLLQTCTKNCVDVFGLIFSFYLQRANLYTNKQDLPKTELKKETSVMYSTPTAIYWYCVELIYQN